MNFSVVVEILCTKLFFKVLHLSVNASFVAVTLVSARLTRIMIKSHTLDVHSWACDCSANIPAMVVR